MADTVVLRASLSILTFGLEEVILYRFWLLLGTREAVVNIYLFLDLGGAGGAARNLELGGEADEYGYSYKMIPKPEGGIDKIYKVLSILLQRHGLGAFEEE